MVELTEKEKREMCVARRASSENKGAFKALAEGFRRALRNIDPEDVGY